MRFLLGLLTGLFGITTVASAAAPSAPGKSGAVLISLFFTVLFAYLTSRSIKKHRMKKERNVKEVPENSVVMNYMNIKVNSQTSESSTEPIQEKEQVLKASNDNSKVRQNICPSCKQGLPLTDVKYCSKCGAVLT
jgi:hypothetical protein